MLKDSKKWCIGCIGLVTNDTQVVSITLVIVSVQAEVLGGVIGFGICTLLCIPTIIRYSIEYGEKKVWKKV
jgi:hypothetical protein